MEIFSDITDALTFSLILQGIGLSVLAIFAPLVIGTLVSYLDESKKSLERRIILTSVLDKWSFLLAIVVLLTLPLVILLFRNCFELILTLLVLWGVALAYFLLKIRLFYQWLSDKDGILLDYFGGVTRYEGWREWVKMLFSRKLVVVNLDEKVKSWGNLWSLNLSEQDYPSDDKFFALLIKDIDSILRAKNERGLNTSYQLLSDFSRSIHKRSDWFVFPYDKFLPKILEWHYQLWRLDDMCKGNYREYINEPTEKIIEYVTEKAFDSPMDADLYFKYLQAHINKYKEEHSNRSRKIAYTRSLANIYRLILRKIADSQDPSAFLQHNFPKNWLITAENLSDPFVKNEWVRIVLEWFRNNMLLGVTETTENNGKMDTINSEMFPEVEPVTWAKILTLMVCEYRLKEIVDKRINFGGTGRGRFMSGDAKDTAYQQEEAEFDRTIELARDIFSEEIARNLGKWENELKTIGANRWRSIIEALGDEQADSSAQQTD